MLASGREWWNVGDRIRVYRTKSGSGGVIEEFEDELIESADRRDYDVEHYARLLRDTFAVRLARALTPDAYEAVFGDPNQMSLFGPPVATIHTILTKTSGNT